MRKTAFVTGGTGFIGSHLVEELQRRGYDEVRCLVRDRLRWLEGMDVVPVHGGLADEARIAEAVRDVDYVYHVAGVTRATEWETFHEANVRATAALLDVVARVNPAVKKVLVTSSLAAVGACPTEVASEETPLQPLSQYGRSKAQMEQAVAVWRERHPDVPVVVVRPPAVYGPREADIYSFFKTVRMGVCPVIGRGDEPALTLVHVHDLVRGMVDAAEARKTDGETYFLGTERSYSWNEIKAATTAALGRPALTIRVPGMFVGAVGAAAEGVGRLFGQYPPFNREKARELRRACKMCTTDKAQRDFGYRQVVDLRDGIAKTIAWYRAEGWL